MKLKTFLTALLLSSGTFLVGCAHHHGHERTAGEVIDDTTITTQVKAALLAERDVNSFDIKVKTYDGTVQLSGFVDSQWQIDKATQVASNVPGVQRVTSALIHKPQ